MKFNIQRFSDTITSSDNLQIEFGFVDGDTRTLNVPNPRNDLAASDVSAVDVWINNNLPIIGDKEGAITNGINSAIIIEKAVNKLDLS